MNKLSHYFCHHSFARLGVAPYYLLTMLSLCAVLCPLFILLSSINCLPITLNELLAIKLPKKDIYSYPEPNILCQEGEYHPDCKGSHNTTTSSPPPSGYVVWIYVSGGLFLLLISLIATCGFVWFRRRKQINAYFAKLHGSANNRNNGNSEQSHKMHMRMSEIERKNQYTNQPKTAGSENCKQDPWEMTSDQLKIFEHEKLGSGAFCFVFKGKVAGKAPICKIQPSIATQNFEDCEVAVKKLPEYADNLAKNDFVQEIDFMKRIGYHSHLVSILGCITDPQLDPCLVIEYCANGDLLKYVRNRRLEIVTPAVDDDSALRFKDLLSFAWQISDGMDFLSSKGCIHRDVAARNVLVDYKKVAKIRRFWALPFNGLNHLHYTWWEIADQVDGSRIAAGLRV